MVQRIDSKGLMRVNKTRARKMYEKGYSITLTMDSRFLTSSIEYEILNTIMLKQSNKDFNHRVTDFYEQHKGELMSYTVEYWVLENDVHEYLYYRQKPYNDRYYAKKHR